MAGIQDFVEFVDDFIGGETFSTAGQGSPWAVAETAAAGTPTYAMVTPSATGEIAITHSSTNEIQNVCLSFGDTLPFDIDNLQSIEMRVKVGAATINAATSLAFGLASARNDAIDSIANHASFRLIGANAVLVETDDSVNDNDDVATGQSLGTAYKKFLIDFTGGKSDVKFYVDGKRVAAATTFDMSNATGSLQPYVQLQKTAATSVDSVTVDYVRIEAKRGV